MVIAQKLLLVLQVTKLLLMAVSCECTFNTLNQSFKKPDAGNSKSSYWLEHICKTLEMLLSLIWFYMTLSDFHSTINMIIQTLKIKHTCWSKNNNYDNKKTQKDCFNITNISLMDQWAGLLGWFACIVRLSEYKLLHKTVIVYRQLQGQRWMYYTSYR